MLIRTGFGGQLSGSVGGVVASHNKGGQYLRNRSIPTNPNTNRQQLVRFALKTAAQAWKTLSGTQRSAWEGYASQTPVVNRLGEAITLSGFNMFVRSYAFYAGAQEASSAPTSAPVTPGLVAIGEDISLVLSVANGLTVNSVGGEVDGPGVISMGPSLSEGVESFGGPYSAALIVADLSDIAGLATALNQTPLRYGSPVVGQRRPLRVVGISQDGRLSGEFRQIVTVAA